MNLTASQLWRKLSIDKPFTISDWLNEIRREYPILPQEINNSIWVLLANVFNQPKSRLLAHTELILESNQKKILNKAFSQLMTGVPLAYLINHWEFYGLDFYVNKSVLIPRPETELLVEKAISWLHSNPNANSMVDIGTGSGCIAISIARIFPKLDIIATDISFSALQVAQKNIQKYSISNIKLVGCNLLAGMKKKFDLICANLPYIATQTLNSLSVGKYEPRIALDGGEDGLRLIKHLFDQAINLLQEKGALLVEFESTQNKEILYAAKNNFPNFELCVYEDLAKNPRLLLIQSK